MCDDSQITAESNHAEKACRKIPGLGIGPRCFRVTKAGSIDAEVLWQNSKGRGTPKNRDSGKCPVVSKVVDTRSPSTQPEGCQHLPSSNVSKFPAATQYKKPLSACDTLYIRRERAVKNSP